MKYILFLIVVFVFIPFRSFSQSRKLSSEEIFKLCSKSVVTIYIVKDKDYIGTASGVFISNRGYLVTNFHVLQGILESEADYAFIKNEEKYESIGKLLCYWEDADLAIFKVKPQKFPGLKIDEGNTLNVGSKIFTISSPIGIENTFTEGMVSKLYYDIPSSPKLYTKIQTTANFTHGSSGGAMLNEFGELVGILQGGIGGVNEEGEDNGARANINFAIPITLLKYLIQSSDCKIEKEPFAIQGNFQTPLVEKPIEAKPKGLQENPGEVIKD